jgi:hypothetical protein
MLLPHCAAPRLNKMLTAVLDLFKLVLSTAAQNKKINYGAERNKNSTIRIRFVMKLILVAEFLFCAAPEIIF